MQGGCCVHNQTCVSELTILRLSALNDITQKKPKNKQLWRSKV